ncbi:MAG: OmpA family protein [Crocinitomicaceae bacterium]|nr:OmpA family protein [Crocinitomicaceae bacterium]
MRFKIVLTIFLLSIASISSAQNKYITKARLAFASENYSEAAEKCAEAYTKLSHKGGKSKKKLKGELSFMTAESYRLTERYREANEWYDRAILLDYQEHVPEVLLYNAEMLRMMSEFEKAIENYEAYAAWVPGDDRASIGIQSCKRNQEFKAEKTKHIIENQTAINKKEFDMAPMFGDRKTTKLYFGSGRDESTGKDGDPRSGEGYMDLWVSDLDKKGNWTEPYLVKGEGINTVDNEGTVCFDQRYKLMFFTRCPNMKKQNLGCDIWVAEAKGKTEWKEPRKIALKTHDSVSVGHPCTRDGKYLIFASDMAGGFGGKDLWYTTYNKKTDVWSTPVNMGPEINTKGNELFPTFALNGDLIYASDGMAGLGGLDIFKATIVGEENKWENPTNMGFPINGSSNDYALIEKTERLGYFTSERKSANGEYVPDIFAYILPPDFFSLKVNVTELGNAEFNIEDVKVVVKGTDGSTWEGYTDENGSVFWDKKPTADNFGERYINEKTEYNINISKEGYHEDKHGSSFTTIGLNYNQKFIVDMQLLPKKPIRLPEVRYPLNQWELLVDSTINSTDSLLFVYNLLEEYPGMVLELSSHTDSRGSDERNQKLSENRARACYKYLVEEKGVDSRRLVPIGKGENEPRKVYKRGEEYLPKQPADMTGVEEVALTEEYINQFKISNAPLFKQLHQLNRRTEGRVLQMDFDAETAPAADAKYLEYVPYR